MSKRIWERFPNHVKKSRISRGTEASGKILSYPTEDEFFHGLFDSLIFYEKNVSNKMLFITLVGRDDENNRFGLLVHNRCICNLCGDPIKGCITGGNLQEYANYILRTIVWFNNYQQLFEYLNENSMQKELLAISKVIVFNEKKV